MAGNYAVTTYTFAVKFPSDRQHTWLEAYVCSHLSLRVLFITTNVRDTYF